MELYGPKEIRGPKVKKTLAANLIKVVPLLYDQHKTRESTIFVLIGISGNETTEKSITESKVSKIDGGFSRSKISEVTTQSSDETKKNGSMKNNATTSKRI